jgi:hypothetical protein
MTYGEWYKTVREQALLDTARELLEAIRANPSPCVHDHQGCSFQPSGPCSDEYLSKHKLDNNADPIVNEDTLSSDRWA